jgi:flagellar biosynthesis/type III secretory pathway M-ring protein FliF/YscJ
MTHLKEILDWVAIVVVLFLVTAVLLYELFRSQTQHEAELEIRRHQRRRDKQRRRMQFEVMRDGQRLRREIDRELP